MIPNYDRVAWIYDWLAGIVFGKKIEEAKAIHLNILKPGDRLLIVGGGTGSLLNYLDQLGITLHVDFIDVSDAMLQRALKLKHKNLSVKFFQVDIKEFNNGSGYDTVFTNFFFDQFNQEDCLSYLEHIKSLCRPGALLLYADFIPPSRLKDRIVSNLMYGFFQMTINLSKLNLINNLKEHQQK